ncbi:hypothetical protein FK513_29955, partial [Klebsiella pneumoniae]|nr:hypothetical protein [Klebsiella pneumoniae]
NGPLRPVGTVSAFGASTLDDLAAALAAAPPGRPAAGAPAPADPAMGWCICLPTVGRRWWRGATSV